MPLANYLDRNATFCKDHTKQWMGQGGEGGLFWKQASGKSLAGIWEAQGRRLTHKESKAWGGCRVTAGTLVLCVFTTEVTEGQRYPWAAVTEWIETSSDQGRRTDQVPSPTCGIGPDFPQLVAPVWTLAAVRAGNTHGLLCTYVYLWDTTISRLLGERLSGLTVVMLPSPANKSHHDKP